VTVNKNPEWVTRGKTIKGLIQELQTFENQDLFVEISLDDSKTSWPISLVLGRNSKCLLVNCENDED